MDTRDDVGVLSTPERAVRHMLDAAVSQNVDEVWVCLATDTRSKLAEMCGSEERAKGWLFHEVQGFRGYDRYELKDVQQEDARATVEVALVAPRPFDDHPHCFVVNLLREDGEWRRAI